MKMKKKTFAYGAFAGDTYANYGLSSQCGC